MPFRALVLVGLVALALPCCAAAAQADTVVLAVAASVEEVLTNIRNWLMGILAGLATVFLTVGGVRRVFGGGDPGEQEKSKEAFKAAGIGYALAALAPLVVTVLKGIVGA
ncbi:pilin [Saccharothrix lopnurensis]|uniref:Pilin n=1 Tax=Saccharothrix lopnurensis TaxID=1670621 RepID=A0ABW1P7U2_9PSEU